MTQQQVLSQGVQWAFYPDLWRKILPLRIWEHVLFLCFTGTLAAAWRHAGHSRAPDDGSGWSRWYPGSSFLLHWDALLQHPWHQHGHRCAQLQRLGTGTRGGTVPLPTRVPRTLLPGNYFFIQWSLTYHRGYVPETPVIGENLRSSGIRLILLFIYREAL